MTAMESIMNVLEDSRNNISGIIDDLPDDTDTTHWDNILRYYSNAIDKLKDIDARKNTK